jgi:hypothetical protein
MDCALTPREFRKYARARRACNFSDAIPCPLFWFKASEFARAGAKVIKQTGGITRSVCQAIAKIDAQTGF